MLKNYFKDKRILITGISGFVGSVLAKKLTYLGANVYGVSKNSEEKDKNILISDILDYLSIDRFVKERRIEICFHLAGVTLVESGQEDPYNAFKTNIEGTLNILEIGRKNNLEKIIIASTSHVYGENKVPYLEAYTPKPSRPYETSKTCADLIAQSYSETFNLPVFIPRFVNIYGPGDLNFNRIIPKTIKSILSGNPVKMWGGDSERDYLYIDDAINAYINLAKADLSKISGNRIFNFGSGNIISVKDLIYKIVKLSNRKIKIELVDHERMSEIKSQYVSFKKAEQSLNWEPRVNLKDGLKKTIDWYKEYLK